MKYQGRFIVIDGIDGSGKSTIVNIISNYLKRKVPSFLLVRDPGSTKIGELIRKILIKQNVEQLDPKSELLLFYASRVQLVNTIIIPAINKGTWILSDRFELSSFAYQGGGRKIKKNFIYSLSNFCFNGFKPDITFFLDIDPINGLKRIIKKRNFDSFEKESLSFLKNVQYSYYEIIKKRMNTPIVSIDANKPLGKIANFIIKKINIFFNLK